MARLLFSTHDPGGANVLLPVMRLARARGHEVAAAAAGPAAKIWREAGESLAEGATAPFARRPDLVVTGAGAGDFDRNLWRGARAAGIATCAALDAWTQLEGRFDGSSSQPDAVIAVDEAMAAAMRALPGWSARIHVGGQPHLEEVARRRAAGRAGHVPNRPPLLAFFSECLREDYRPGVLGYDQFSVGTLLLDALPACAPVTLAIKPHPREDAARWRGFVGARPAVAGVSVSVSDENSERLMLRADAVVGITTMMLIEAALAGIPVLSVQPDRKSTTNPMVDALPGRPVTDATAVTSALAALLAHLDVVPTAGHLGGMIRDAAERTLAAIEREAAGIP